MRKAYDTFLQSEVSSSLAAKSGGFEPYRYECAHCGEEVRLAAAGSKSMVAHFRHRSGNNDVDCENYLGQYGAISVDSRSRKSRTERAEFYFDSNTKMFYLGLCFSDNEIAAYEEESAKFEMRASAQEQAFSTTRINGINFMPDSPRMIHVERFSYSYFLSNTLSNVKRRYDIFKKDGSPVFFKILGSDINNYRAKLIRSTILYTDVPYFTVAESRYQTPISNASSDIEITNTSPFETMGKKFIGQTLVIKNKTSDIEALLESWGYQVEASETLALLWPPSAQMNESSVIKSDCAFLFSSFKLEPHGNINVHSDDIKSCGNGVSKVAVKSRVKVFRKNAEIIIETKEPQATKYDDFLVEERYDDTIKVSDKCVWFLFNRSGLRRMGEGQSTTLTLGSSLKRYDSGYLNGIIYPKPQEVLSGERLLDDILAHYKRTEAFATEAFASLTLSDTASKYLANCRESGIINSAAKKLIEEGRL